MTMPTLPGGLLGSMLGGLQLPSILCAPCIVESYETTCTTAAPCIDCHDAGEPICSGVVEPNNAVTVVAGTLVCADHARQQLAAIDNGHIAAAIGGVVDQVERVATHVDDLRREVTSRRG